MAEKRTQLALSQTSVLKLYHTVIDDVIGNVRDAFLDEGVDEQVLQELKQVWRNKLMASKAVEVASEPAPTDNQPPPIVLNNPRQTSKTSNAKARKTVVAAQSTIANGNKKDTVNLQNPPPLHSTSGASGSQTSHSSSNSIPVVATLDPNRIMPVNITLPAQAGVPNSESRVLTIHVPASALQENTLTQILTATLVSSIMSLPTQLASSVLQQHVNAALTSANMIKRSKQVDGALDSSEDDESEESDDNLDVDEDGDLDRDEEEIDPEIVAEEEPLNSEDDVSDEEGDELFETDNVIVCQYDKITRSRNKWKFYLKDGIMNLNGKDYVFQKSNGEAEW